MSYTISAAAKTALGLTPVELDVTATLWKQYLNADDRVSLDITELVIDFGQITNESSALNIDREQPNNTIRVKNEAKQFSPGSASSWWQEAPAQVPKQCVITLDTKLRVADGSLETIATYVGRITEAALELGQDAGSVILIESIDFASVAMSGTTHRREGGIDIVPDGVW